MISTSPNNLWRFFPIFLFCLILSSLLSPCFSSLTASASENAVTNEVVVTTSGRRIPLYSIQMHLPNIPSSEISKHVYEITSDLMLINAQPTIPAGENKNELRTSRTTQSFNLKRVTKEPRLVQHGEDGKDLPTVTLNGQPYQEKHLDVYVRTGGGFVVSILKDGSVIGVWGRGIKLLPLPGHSNVFIDVAAKQKASTSNGNNSLHADAIFPPPDELGEDDSDSNVPDTQTSEEKSKASRAKSTCRKKNPRKIIEVASAFDNTLCAQYGNKPAVAIATVRSVVYAAEEAYAKQTCLLLNPVHIEAHCKDKKDPYKRLSKMSDAESMLKAFRNIWFRKRKSVHRDVGYFFPGFTDSTGTVGIAFVGATCVEKFHYGMVEGLDPFVTAHEIGHNVNCLHDSSGIMQATVPFNKVMEFSDTSVNEMVKFIDSHKNAKCITKGSRPPPPSPPPSPSPRADKGKCSFGFAFDDTKGMDCSDGLAGTVFFNSGSVTAYVIQQYERFDVRLRMSDEYSFEIFGTKYVYSYHLNKYRVLVSTEDTVRSGDKRWKGGNFGKKGTSKDVLIKWPASKVPIPAGKDSCCFSSLYVHVQLTTTYTHAEITGSTKKIITRKTESDGAALWTFVICDVCIGTKLTRMTPKRKCPVCS